MYNIRPTTKFQKDLKRVKKRGFDISFLTQKGTSANPFSGQPMCFFLGPFLQRAPFYGAPPWRKSPGRMDIYVHQRRLYRQGRGAGSRKNFSIS